MVLPPEEEAEAAEGSDKSESHWAAFKRMYKEMRRRVELDAVPWLRIVCAEGGIALRLYTLVGAEEICSLPTIDVMEYMAILGFCFFAALFLLRWQTSTNRASWASDLDAVVKRSGGAVEQHPALGHGLQ